MAFIGLFMVMIAVFFIVLILGIMPILVGTYLIKRTNRKKLGIFLRIIGYIITIPIILIVIMLAIIIK